MNKENKIGAGFTIIELIVVIAIIAVLAGVVIINVVKYIESSKVSAVIANMETIKKTSVQMYVDNGNYQNLLINCYQNGCQGSTNTSVRLAMEKIFSLKPFLVSYFHTFFLNSNNDKWCGCVNFSNSMGGINTYCVSGNNGNTITGGFSTTSNCYNRCNSNFYNCQ